MTKEQHDYYQDVLKEAAHLLGARSVLDLTVDASTPDVAWQAQEDGRNAADVARQLVDDEAIR